ncbi:MAG TPA: CHAP domain-containing protein [Actinospica sp.]|nr:CHAP domain-containing protein [Actinospica sp.]
MPRNRILSLTAAALLATPILAATTTSTAYAGTVGDAIESAVVSQIGAGPCSNTASGSTNGDAGYYATGTGQGNSCSHPGTASSPVDSGQTHAWCADFAGWSWQQAGVTVDGSLDDLASSFYDYGVAHGTWSSTPHVGDAVYFDSSIKGGNGHVAIVTAVNSNGTIDDVGGNEKDANGNWIVQHDVGWIKAQPGSQVVWTENGANVYVQGYASPVGGAPAIPSGFNVTIDANGSALTGGQRVTGTVDLTAMASSQGYINSLSYAVTGPNGYTDTIAGGSGSGNYAQPWNTAGLTAGSYSIKAVANEVDGQNHTYGPINFTVGFGPNPLPSGGWEAMWLGADTQNPGGSLWLAPGSGNGLSAAANDPQYLGVAKGTSPSMAVLPNGSWVAAWHGTDTTNPSGSLWVATGTGNTLTAVGEPGNLGVAAGSSPSIVAMPDNTWTVAWHGADTTNPGGSLWVATGSGTGLDAAATSPGNLGVAANSSPSLIAMPNGTWTAAWHGADTVTPSGSLWVATGNGTGLTAAATRPGNLGVAADTSPSLVLMPNGTWTAAWHGADTITPNGSLWVVTGNGTGLTAAATSPGNLGVAANTSPSITAMGDGTWTAAWHGADTITPNGSLWVATGSGTGLDAAATSPGNLGVAANTSPFIVTMPDGSWMTAWHGADTINANGSLWVAPGRGTGLSAAATSPGNLGVAAGSSPTLVP